MRFSIIVSEKDQAGLNIKMNLLLNFKFKETGESYQGYPIFIQKTPEREILLFTLSKDTIFHEEAEKEIPADIFIFATRHQSQSGDKTLSIHVPGNYGKAEHGGKDRELCTVYPSLMKEAFILLTELGEGTDFSVTLETTHHGPLIKKPVFFIEIGSREKEWGDINAGEIIAKAIMGTIWRFSKKTYRVAIGFGGTHYCPGFNKIQLGKDIAIGHICPRYSFGKLDKEMVLKMIAASFEKVDFALLDWKGLNGEERNKIIAILEEIKMPWKKTKDIL